MDGARRMYTDVVDTMPSIRYYFVIKSTYKTYNDVYEVYFG